MKLVRAQVLTEDRPAPDVEPWNARQRAYWSEISNVYDSLYEGSWSALENAWVARQLEFIATLDSPLVVDLGAGTCLGGQIVRSLNPGAYYVAVDLCEEMLRAAKARPRAVIAAMDDLACFKSGSVDVALALFSSASYAARLERLISEVARILRPGGRAHLSVLSSSSWSKALSRRRTSNAYATRGDPRPAAETSVHRVDAAALRAELGANALTIESLSAPNVLSGVAEFKALWPLGRGLARLMPQASHTLEIRVKKEDRRD